MNTQVQKICTEIERRIELLKKLKKNDFTEGSIDAYNGILILIDSLQQEQVVMSDTDKSNLRDVPAIIRASNHPFKENLALTFEKYIK